MNIQECTEAIRAKVGDNSGLNAVLKFDCGDDGKIVIDGASTPTPWTTWTAKPTAPWPSRWKTSTPCSRPAQPRHRFHERQVQGQRRHERRHEAATGGVNMAAGRTFRVPGRRQAATTAAARQVLMTNSDDKNSELFG